MQVKAYGIGRLRIKNITRNSESDCSLATRAAIPLLEAGSREKELLGGIAAWETTGVPAAKEETGIKVNGLTFNLQRAALSSRAVAGAKRSRLPQRP
jgi:hypothetical protein